MVDRNHASVSSIVVSTSRCGRDIPGSNPGWRKNLQLRKITTWSKIYTTTSVQFLLHARTRRSIHIAIVGTYTPRTDRSTSARLLGSVVEHPPSKRKVRGSIPREGSNQH